jgi:hypothetical protein
MESNDCYALTRYELDGNLYQVPEHSQDVWIFKEMVKDIFGEFYLGIGGCDNRIAYEIEKSGYNISNPCLSIKVHHVHTDTNREWLNLKRIDPPYLMVKECRVK